MSKYLRPLVLAAGLLAGPTNASAEGYTKQEFMKAVQDSNKANAEEAEREKKGKVGDIQNWVYGALGTLGILGAGTYALRIRRRGPQDGEDEKLPEASGRKEGNDENPSLEAMKAGAFIARSNLFVGDNQHRYSWSLADQVTASADQTQPKYTIKLKKEDGSQSIKGLTITVPQSNSNEIKATVVIEDNGENRAYQFTIPANADGSYNMSWLQDTVDQIMAALRQKLNLDEPVPQPVPPANNLLPEPEPQPEPEKQRKKLTWDDLAQGIPLEFLSSESTEVNYTLKFKDEDFRNEFARGEMSLQKNIQLIDDQDAVKYYFSMTIPPNGSKEQVNLRGFRAMPTDANPFARKEMDDLNFNLIREHCPAPGQDIEPGLALQFICQVMQGYLNPPPTA